MTTDQSDSIAKHSRKKRKCTIESFMDFIHETFGTKESLLKKAECLEVVNPEAARALHMRIIKKFGY